MEARAQALIFGLTSLTSTTPLGVVLGKDNGQTVTTSKRETVDGYIEMGLLEDERDMVLEECNSLSNKEECIQIMEWSYRNGSCNIYIAPEGLKDYEHWYYQEFEPGLLDQLKSNLEDYPKLCREKKSINFHFDKKENKWNYDGYLRHSWS